MEIAFRSPKTSAARPRFLRLIMVETTPEGYKILIRTDGSKEFMIDSDRLEACIEYIKKMDIRLIGISSFLGYKRREISFLSELTEFVEGIIIQENFSDISVLNSLHKLRTLGFCDNKKTIIDLSNFPELSTLACDYSNRLLSLESCEQLQHLSLTRFKSTSRTIEELPRLASLKTLDLFVPNIISLDGIGKFPLLQEIALFRASHLVNILSLEAVKLTLTNLEFDQCRKISSYDILAELDNLERLIIGKSAPIESLSFVKSLTKLEFLSFVDTNVVDGDLSPAIGIGYVGFDDRQHYSHRFKEISGRLSKV